MGSLRYSIIAVLAIVMALFSCDEGNGTWKKHVVGVQKSATYMDVADIDLDGRKDIISANTDHAARFISEVAWFKNSCRETWSKIVVTDDSVPPIINATGVAAADIDGDGLRDIVVAASGEPKGMYDTTGGGLYWFKARGCPLGAWDRFDIVVNDNEKYYKVYTIDPDNDGNMDIVVGGSKSAVIFMNPGDPARNDAQWKKIILPIGTGNCINLDDMNNDGTIDLLNGNFAFQKVSWVAMNYDSAQDLFNFNEHVVYRGLRGAFDVMAMNITDDRMKDLVVTKIMAPGIHWFEAPKDENGIWTEHSVDPAFEATDVYTGDINLNGRTDFVVAGYSMGMGKNPDSVTWFEYEKNEDSITWQKHIVDETIKGPGDISLNDMNWDGRPDVVTVSYTDGLILWYENQM